MSAQRKKVRLRVAGSFSDGHLKESFDAMPHEDQQFLYVGVGCAQKALLKLSDGTLGAWPDRASVSFAHGSLLAAIASATQLAMRGAPKAAQPACGAGCDACCRQPVAVTFLEVATIVDRFRRGGLNYARQFAELTDGKSFAQAWAMKLACPLLDSDGRCSVYTARPIVCATHHSLVRAACKGGPEAIVYRSGRLVALQSGVLGGLQKVLRGLGLDSRLVYLDKAMIACVDDPGLVDRWLVGERLPESLHPSDPLGDAEDERDPSVS